MNNKSNIDFTKDEYKFQITPQSHAWLGLRSIFEQIT